MKKFVTRETVTTSSDLESHEDDPLYFPVVSVCPYYGYRVGQMAEMGLPPDHWNLAMSEEEVEDRCANDDTERHSLHHSVAIPTY